MIQKDFFWTAIVLLAIGTFAIRYSFLAFSNKFSISDRQRELLTFVPACLLPALVAPMVYNHQGDITWLYGKERMAVLFLAIVFFQYFKSMIMTLVFGLGVLFMLTFL